MTKLELIIELIAQNKNIEEIKKILNISDITLLKYLNLAKKLGNFYNQVIDNNGNLYFSQDKFIKLNPTNKKLNLIAVSDLHFGSGKERIDYLDKVYDYSVQNDICIILNLGDLIDGNTSKVGTFDQIEKVLENYPYDRNIKNIILLGNHDFHSLYYDGIDIRDYLFNERIDFISAGYGIAYIDILNYKLLLKHDLSVKKIKENNNINPFMKLSGHSHRYKTTIGENLLIKVPTLSDITSKNGSHLAGFLEIKMIINDLNVIEKVIIRNMVPGNEIKISNELVYSIPYKKIKK